MTLAILLPLLAVGGCGLDEETPDGSTPRVRAAFALAAAERNEPAPPDDGSPEDGSDRGPDDRLPDPDCPRCHGSGTVRSGDGLARVPCDCLRRSSKGQELKNQVEEPAAETSGGAAEKASPDAAPRVLVFSAAWCPACVTMKPALAAAGPGFEVIDHDANPAVVAAYGVTRLPTLVRVVGGRETARAVGVRGVSGLQRFRDAGR
jgi:thiol-disulfide isomerase/thioredoxin